MVGGGRADIGSTRPPRKTGALHAGCRFPLTAVHPGHLLLAERAAGAGAHRLLAAQQLGLALAIDGLAFGLGLRVARRFLLGLVPLGLGDLAVTVGQGLRDGLPRGQDGQRAVGAERDRRQVLHRDLAVAPDAQRVHHRAERLGHEGVVERRKLEAIAVATRAHHVCDAVLGDHLARDELDHGLGDCGGGRDVDGLGLGCLGAREGLLPAQCLAGTLAQALRLGLGRGGRLDLDLGLGLDERLQAGQVVDDDVDCGGCRPFGPVLADLLRELDGRSDGAQAVDAEELAVDADEPAQG